METTSLRDRFLSTLERFNGGELDIAGLWEEVEVLNRQGFHRELSGGQEADAVSRFGWYLDRCDPELQPRPGLAGRLRDKFDEAFRDEYRVSPQALRAEARAVERVMKRGNGH